MTKRTRMPHVFACALLLLGFISVDLPGAAAQSLQFQRARSTRPAASTSSGCSRSQHFRGNATIGDWQFPDTLNPYQTSRLVTRQITNALFLDLFQYDARARLTPQMAATIPTSRNGGVRDGGRSIVIHLKPGLHWSDGAEITSTDIQFGWRVGMDRATGPGCLGTCDLIRHIDTAGRYVAVLRLRHSDSSAVPAAMPTLWPHVWRGSWRDNPHVAALVLGQDAAYSFENTHYPTDGPYQVSSFRANNRIVMKPMARYTGPGCTTRLASLTFLASKSKSDLISSAAAHKSNVTADYNRTDLPAINRHRAVYRVMERTTFALEHLEMNLDSTYGGKSNPLHSVRVRQALALALDRVGLVRTALGLGPHAAAERTAWTPYVHTPDLSQPGVRTSLNGQWDPVAHAFVQTGTAIALRHARTLLGQTPFKKGFSLDLSTTQGSAGRQAQEASIASSWAKLGVKVVPNYVSPSKLLGTWRSGGTLAHGHFQVAMFALLSSPEPESIRYNLESRYCDRRIRSHSVVNGNYGCVRDRVVDAHFDAAARAVDARTRGADFATLQLRINRQVLWIPLYFRPTIATTDDRVTHVSPNPTQQGITWNLYAWSGNQS